MIPQAKSRPSPLPVYYQIGLDIRQRISSGEWRSGHRLPSEPDLAKEYDVSRMTVRQAMRDLVNDGILSRRRGDGTYVSRAFLDISMNRKWEMRPEIESAIDRYTLHHEIHEQLRQVAIPDSRFHFNFEEFVPDFQGSVFCADKIREMEVYRQSRTIFITPDNSLTLLRQYAIEDQKTLVMATYGIARGFMIYEPGQVASGDVAYAASLDGMERLARPITLQELRSFGEIDLLVTGVWQITEDGVRWGKGYGFFDLEWAMFRESDLVEENTVVIAVGHDCQVAATKLTPTVFDTVADFIITPSRHITIERTHARPEGVLWDYLAPDLPAQIPPLRSLLNEMVN